MDGSSRKRQRRRACLPSQPEPAPTELTTLAHSCPEFSLFDGEVPVAERPLKKTCHSSVSTSSALCEPHVWPGLMDSMLHQIIALLSSFQDLLAFSGTCRSWRAALSSFPSVYTFTFPPLHLKPDIRNVPPRCSSFQYSLLSHCKWQLGDPSKRNLSLRCSAPRNTPNRMRYLGCSYGYLIFSYRENCLLVDVYTGTKVKPPKLQCAGNRDIYYGILTAPLNSPNLHLLLCSRCSIFYWQVGTNSWSEHPFGGERILLIVLFKGKMLAMDFLNRLHTMSFGPELSIQEVAVVQREEMVTGLHLKPWLVVCGDMLLMVDFSVSKHQLLSCTFQVFRLDVSAETAKWMKMEKLENQALFVSFDRRNPTFSCMSRGRWDGKNNCIYFVSPSGVSDEPWTAIELGKPVPFSRVPLPAEPNAHCVQLESLWVLPSFIYGVNQ